MGNSATRSRRKNIQVGQTKRARIIDSETSRTGRQDFSTTQTLPEDIPFAEAQTPAEDIIIKCSLEEMTKSFFQEFVIVWHDPNINSQENQQYFTQLKKFCDVLTFTEWQKAKDFIKSTHAACHVVTSGTNGELLVKEIAQHQSVANIYIFCENQEYHSSWAKTHQKVSCIETNIESLLSQIQRSLLEWHKQASSLKLNLPAFAPIFNDYDKTQMNNLHRFLKFIPNFQNRLQAKTDFLDISKAIYSDKLIVDFEQNYNEYNKEQTLRWYTQESFLYKVTNNCLRIATSDSIQYCRLLLQDLQKAIREQYQTKSKNFNGLLYRGAYLSQEEWSSLKANLNREIEMHGFLSVSKVKNIGLNFMKADPSKKVFITIIVPQGPNEEEQGFAEVQEFSQFPAEKEVLFNVRSRFTILETEDEGLPYRHLVLLYGAQGFRKYMTEQNPMIQVKIDKISCNQCKTTSSEQMFFISLIDPHKQNYYCKECLDSNFAPFLCLPPDIKETFTTRISGFLLKNSNPPLLPFYGYKCSSSSSEGCKTKKQKPYFFFFFTCTDCHQQWCQNCFENSHDRTHNIILETTPFTFWSQKMSPAEINHLKFQKDSVTNTKEMFWQAEMYSESLLFEKAAQYYMTYIKQNEAKDQDINLAYCYHGLGVAFYRQGEYAKALEYSFKAVNTFKLISGDYHPDIAFPYTCIGQTYTSQGRHEQALIYFMKALDVNKLVCGETNHLPLATSYYTLGLCYFNQEMYENALVFYFKYLEINELFYGKIHPHVADSYRCIGTVYNRQGKYKEALENFLKSLDIQKSIYGESHLEVANSYHSVGNAFDKQGEYSKALEYYLKSLNISKSIFGDNNRWMTACLNDIGFILSNQGEYEKALECLLKSLAISEGFHKDPDAALSYHHLGNLCSKRKEYCKALEYYFKFLEINKSVNGENHHSIATTCSEIGQVYSNQGKYSEALEYYFKSLELYKSPTGENNIFSATICSKIGDIYYTQGEYSKTLEYYSKALEINIFLHGENHSNVAASYFRLSSVYHQQNEYGKALEYSFKCLDSNKSLYGEMHPTVATAYYYIGIIFHQQGELKKAVEYYFKSLNICKLIYGGNHPQTIETQNKILEVLSMSQDR